MNQQSAEHAWRALTEHGKRVADRGTRSLFDEAPGRFEALTWRLDDLLVDFSRQRLQPRTVNLLADLARAVDLEGERERMFAGECINRTEGRAVLHVALRDASGRGYLVSGRNVAPEIAGVRERIRAFTSAVRFGAVRGYTGRPFRHVVNIGIGGSDLGPRMVVRALTPFAVDGPKMHFVANVDGADLIDTLAGLDPAETLFVIASKTFTTQETMTNAESARRWLVDGLGDARAVAAHFVALSTNLDAVAAFGVPEERTFGFWDFVGGRFSLWSAIGLPVALAIGFEGFEALLAGAHAMDRHFEQAPLEDNLPVLLALVGVWNRNVLGIGAHAVLPYEQRLELLPAYLQQAEMESNGKAVTRDGRPVPRATCPVIFGEPGTNGQHAFYQLLHQGTSLVSMDLIAAARPIEALGDHHEKLLANFLAQGEAFATGRTRAEVEAEMRAEGVDEATIARLAPHRTFPGGRPLTSIVHDRLDPHSLGRLIALYEHKVFCQGVLWDINSFDQWGVELGKTIARRLLPALTGAGGEDEAQDTADAATAGLLAHLLARRRSS